MAFCIDVAGYSQGSKVALTETVPRGLVNFINQEEAALRLEFSVGYAKQLRTALDKAIELAELPTFTQECVKLPQDAKELGLKVEE